MLRLRSLTRANIRTTKTYTNTTRYISTPASPSHSSPSSSSCDVLISGGGLVGLAAAAALSRLGASVALIQDKPYAKANDKAEPPSLRCSSLSPSSHAFLRSLSVDYPSQCFSSMLVWGRRGVIQWEAEEYNRVMKTNTPIEGLGYLVQNQQVESALLSHLARAPSFRLVCPAALVGVRRQGASKRVTLDNGNTIDTRLIIGADGPGSVVKQLLESLSPLAGSVGVDYQQQALVFNVESEQTNDKRNTAYQRFINTGPIAAIPINTQDQRNIYSIVWSSSISHIAHLRALKPTALVDELNQALQQEQQLFSQNTRSGPPDFLAPIFASLFPTRIPSPPLFARLVAPPAPQPPTAAFPLRISAARQYASVDSGLVLIGDSAHTVHPMAGQGLNLGLSDVQRLVRAIDGALLSGLAVDSAEMLGRFDSECRTANNIHMAGLHAIHEIFVDEPNHSMLAHSSSFSSSPVGLVDGALSAAVKVFNAVPAIKYQAAKQAMGIQEQQ